MTRALASTDATLSGLTLSGVDFGTFASATFASATVSYTAEVTNNPTETTVTPIVNHSGASYVIKVGGVTDADGTVTLERGSNVITVEVTAEDGITEKTYTVTVTRLVTSQQTQASTDATLSGLTLTGVDFGTFTSSTVTYTASVAYSVSETTVTPTLNDSDASYVTKLGGTEVSDGTVSLAVGSNVITVDVTAEDGSTTQTYTVTVTRAAAPLVGDLATDDPPVNLRVSGYDSVEVSLAWEIPRNRGITEYELVRNDHDGTEFARSDWSVSASAYGGDSVAESSTGLTADSRYRYDLSLKSGNGTVIIEKSLEVRTPASGAAALSTDTTLSALSISGVTLDSDFSSSIYRYSGSVANDIMRTTVTAVPSDTAASHAVKLGGVAAEDSVLDIQPGRNVITVHVTAQDGVTTGVYTVVVSRAKLAGTRSTDASLRALFLSGLDIGTFDSETTSYTAQAGHDVSPDRGDRGPE